VAAKFNKLLFQASKEAAAPYHLDLPHPKREQLELQARMERRPAAELILRAVELYLDAQRASREQWITREAIPSEW